MRNLHENLLTFWLSGKSCMVIQSFVLRRCASMSSSGFPEKSGWKWDQFKWWFAIGMRSFSGKGFGLFGWSGSSGPSAGMSRGWFGCFCSSAGRSKGWFGVKCGKSTSPNDTSESELITLAVLPSFFLESPSPFTWA